MANKIINLEEIRKNKESEVKVEVLDKSVEHNGRILIDLITKYDYLLYDVEYEMGGAIMTSISPQRFEVCNYYFTKDDKRKIGFVTSTTDSVIYNNVVIVEEGDRVLTINQYGEMLSIEYMEIVEFNKEEQEWYCENIFHCYYSPGKDIEVPDYLYNIIAYVVSEIYQGGNK